MKSVENMIKNISLQNANTDSERVNFRDFGKPCKLPVIQKRWSPPNRARREANKNKLVEKGWVSHRVKTHKKSKVSRIVRGPGMICEIIHNELKKLKNLIKIITTKMKTGPARENQVRFQKKE